MASWLLRKSKNLVKVSLDIESRRYSGNPLFVSCF
jgi:hypothetical protein